MRLSEKLGRLSAEQGYTNIAEIARLAQVSRSSCYRWFEGVAYPDVRDALKLARFFGVSLDYLADEEADHPPPSNELTEDERFVLDVFHSLGLTRREAMRRLALAPGGAAGAVAVGTAPRPEAGAPTVSTGHPVAVRDETALQERLDRGRDRPPRGSDVKKGHGPSRKGEKP